MTKPVSNLSTEELQESLRGLQAELQRRQPKIEGWRWEEALEAPLLSQAYEAKQRFLLEMSSAETNEPKPCPDCGRPIKVKARRSRTIQSLRGKHSFLRNYHHCGKCKHGFYPMDAALGLSAKGDLSPRMESLVLDLGAATSYQEAAHQFELHHRVAISKTMVAGVVDRAGVVWNETSISKRTELREIPKNAAQTLVAQVDDSFLRTREKDETWKASRLGLVYNHEDRVNKSRAEILRTSYVGHLSNSEAFEAEFRAVLEAHRADQTPTVLWVADGSAFNWNLQQRLVPKAVPILDFFHVAEHLGDASEALFGLDVKSKRRWMKTAKTLLLHRSVRAFFEWLETQPARFAKQYKKLSALGDLSRYLERHRDRMHYRRYRRRGWPIGSGAIESGHKTIFQLRMKRPGQRWDLTKGQNLAQIRAIRASVGAENLYDTIRKAA